MVVQTVSPSPETLDFMKEVGGEKFELCYQCGLCTGTCPWNRVRSFMLRKLIHQAQLGLVDFEDEDLWTCVGCKACVDRCPRGVEVVDIMRDLRRVIVEAGVGKVPDSLRLVAKNFAAVGNPLGEPRETRPDWAKDLGVKTYTKGTEILYFPCCIQTYDPSIQRVARAAANILNKADVDFGILGAEVSCCGESIRKSGSESVFQSLARNNIEAFTKAGVNKIVVTSPHCYHTFMQEYPELGGNFEVIHLSQYLNELINEGRLKFTKELNKKVTYQDSCCLGRYAGMYDEPRQTLKSIPGLELLEMWEYRENSLCCGGCAGRLWMETKKGERFSDLRLEQALETGASILAVACPYCMLNFEDSVLTSDKGDVIEIRDIAELVQEVI
ncbi:MAG TPA: (Fe-S)-binding protein [Dehalococcoidia bacterium]|nr:(Fe-S)-binding protein [Dehalococcoidia bacterium]